MIAYYIQLWTPNDSYCLTDYTPFHYVVTHPFRTGACCQSLFDVTEMTCASYLYAWGT